MKCKMINKRGIMEGLAALLVYMVMCIVGKIGLQYRIRIWEAASQYSVAATETI